MQAKSCFRHEEELWGTLQGQDGTHQIFFRFHIYHIQLIEKSCSSLQLSPLSDYHHHTIALWQKHHWYWPHWVCPAGTLSSGNLWDHCPVKNNTTDYSLYWVWCVVESPTKAYPFTHTKQLHNDSHFQTLAALLMILVLHWKWHRWICSV